jgi:hypothetical protein
VLTWKRWEKVALVRIPPACGAAETFGSARCDSWCSCSCGKAVEAATAARRHWRVHDLAARCRTWCILFPPIVVQNEGSVPGEAAASPALRS